MNNEQMAAFCALLMCSDPWPTSEAEKKLMNDFANEQARSLGFVDWIDAYNQLPTVYA